MDEEIQSLNPQSTRPATDPLGQMLPVQVSRRLHTVVEQVDDDEVKSILYQYTA